MGKKKKRKIDRRQALRAAIQMADMSIPQVARLAGVNQQTIYNYLASRQDMTLTLYDRVMAVC